MTGKRILRRLDWTSIVSLLVIVAAVFGTLCILAATGVLDSDDAAAWVAAVFAGGILIVAGAALWPAANQVKQAARASEESHRPYVSLGTRLSIEGVLYLDLVNHGDRAALDVAAILSRPPVDNVRNTEMPEAPFGLVTYLAPNERRSVVYSGPQKAETCPLKTRRDDRGHRRRRTPRKARVPHDLDALKAPVLTNPRETTGPLNTLTQGRMDPIRTIANIALGQLASSKRLPRKIELDVQEPCLVDHPGSCRHDRLGASFRPRGQFGQRADRRFDAL